MNHDARARCDRGSVRRGLVLEGGGAKGAYAFGALLALAESGLTFHSIAGTSVGALNAALFASGELAYGRRFWENLSLRSICRPRLAFLALWLLVPVHLIGLLALRLRYLPISPPFDPRQSAKDGLGLVLGILTGVILVPLTIISLFSLATLGRGIVNEGRLLSLWWSDLLDIVGSGWLFLVVCFLWSVPYLLRLVGFSVFDTRPLEDELLQRFGEARFSCPVYATLAHRTTVFDPDDPAEYVLASQYHVHRKVMSHEVAVPVYVRLDSIRSSMERAKVLLASAALPLGVFPSVAIDGTEYVDGGVGDNLPILPLVENGGVHELIVIRLRPPRVSLRRHAIRVARTIKLARIGRENALRAYREEMRRRGLNPEEPHRFRKKAFLPYRSVKGWPSRIVQIAPRQRLGGVLSGTMNFRAKYARRLLAQGYRDALTVIEAEFCGRGAP